VAEVRIGGGWAGQEVRHGRGVDRFTPKVEVRGKAGHCERLLLLSPGPAMARSAQHPQVRRVVLLGHAAERPRSNVVGGKPVAEVGGPPAPSQNGDAFRSRSLIFRHLHERDR
jgi:hypothetical protein